MDERLGGCVIDKLQTAHTVRKLDRDDVQLGDGYVNESVLRKLHALRELRSKSVSQPWVATNPCLIGPRAI